MAITERWPLKHVQSETGINGNDLWGAWARTGTNATYRNSSGNVVTAAADTPRYEYDENGNCLGIWLEQSKTENLSSGAQGDLSSTYWSHSQITYNAAGGGTAPDGTSTADSFVDDDSGAARIPRISENVSAGANQTDCYSIFAKLITAGTTSEGWVYIESAAFTSVSAKAWFNLADGTQGSTSGGNVIDAGIIPYGNGWYRIWLTWQNETDTAGAFAAGLGINSSTSYLADGKEVAFWGPQAEDSSQGEGNGPSSFAIGARSRDTITHADITGWYSAGTGITAVAEWFKYGERSRSTYIFELHQSLSNTLTAEVQSPHTIRLLGSSIGLSVTSNAAIDDVYNSTHRFAYSVASNDARVASPNDAEPLTKDISVTWPNPTDYDKIDLGTSSGGLTYNPGTSGGLILRDLIFYDTTSTDAELIALAANGVEYSTSFPGNVAGDGGHIWPPRANDPRWTQILVDSGITETGNFQDDVKAALIALSGASGGSLDDLWKRTLAVAGVTDTSEPYLY
jgi:hypothetical protein